jgi:hypothetical protein
MSALNAKPSSSLNGIKYISRSILAILELQNVRNAEEKGFAREKINGIFFVNAPQESIPNGMLFRFLGVTMDLTELFACENSRLAGVLLHNHIDCSSLL